jgi:hypothetical protein
MLDRLPGAEPHTPTSKEQALLCFGETGETDATRNWFKPTSAAPGSDEKIAVLAFRAKHGLPLFHDEDRQDYNGWTVGLPQKILDRN